MTEDEMERKLSASTGEAHFHYTRASYFESLVGRCHEALGEDAGSDHDSLPEAIATHIRERDQRISELERALATRPEEQAIKLLQQAFRALEEECISVACKSPERAYTTPSAKVLNDIEAYLKRHTAALDRSSEEKK